MGCAIIDSFFRIITSEKSVNQTRSKTVASAYAVKDLQIGTIDGFIKLSIRPADSAPVIDSCGFHSALGCRADFIIRKDANGLFDHLLKFINIYARNIFIHSFHFKSQAGSKIFFITDHDIDIIRDALVYFPGLVLTTDTFP